MQGARTFRTGRLARICLIQAILARGQEGLRDLMLWYCNWMSLACAGHHAVWGLTDSCQQKSAAARKTVKNDD